MPTSSQPAWADGDTEKFKFPPIDRSIKNRCAFTSSAMGQARTAHAAAPAASLPAATRVTSPQANAARDSLYDLRECDLSGSNAAGFDISGALMARGDFSKTDFKEAQLSKVYGEGAKFDGADFTNGVIDRAYFKDASFKGAKFNNAVLSGTNLGEADLENTDFTEAYLGDFDQRKLCKNPTLKGEHPTTGAPTRESAGCVSK